VYCIILYSALLIRYLVSVTYQNHFNRTEDSVFQISIISMELDASSTSNGYLFILKGLSLIPIWHYLLTFATLLTCFLYNFLEIHFLQDLFSGFSCSPVQFSYNSYSQIYNAVVSKCPILQGGYSVTPWLSSPHLQTIFLNFFGNAPSFKYKRSQLSFHIFILSLFLCIKYKLNLISLLVSISDNCLLLLMVEPLLWTG